MNGNSMDVDSEPVNGARSTTPPNPKAQTNFSVPIPNGSSHDDGAPPPPPHKSNPGSPTITPEEDAEAYKAAGNRFFKEKNYYKAIEQYSKGMHRHLPSGSSYCQEFSTWLNASPNADTQSQLSTCSPSPLLI
jgi:hypothetical protein